MNIIYNGQEGVQNLVTFSDIPNILKVEDVSGGLNATLTITLQGNLSTATTQDGQYTITVLGETISNVLNPSNAVNKTFYISTANTSTCASICKALRNCIGIAAQFNVMNSGSSVTLTAKNVGVIWGNNTRYWSTNIPSSYISAVATDGDANSELYGGVVDVDVYSDGEYITSLEKNFYNGEVAWNMTPVLTSIAKIGEAVPYTFKLSSIVNGEYSSLGEVDENYIAQGYM